jgi:hypothetical protein
MTVRSHSTIRASTTTGRQVAVMTLFGALSLTTMLAVAQPSDDVGVLTKQLDQLLQQGSYGDAVTVAQRALAASERQFGAPDNDAAGARGRGR